MNTYDCRDRYYLYMIPTVSGLKFVVKDDGILLIEYLILLT